MLYKTGPLAKIFCETVMLHARSPSWVFTMPVNIVSVLRSAAGKKSADFWVSPLARGPGNVVCVSHGLGVEQRELT